MEAKRLREIYKIDAEQKMLIGGQWVRSSTGAVLPIENPYTQEKLGTIPHASEADVDHAVSAARQAFENGAWPEMSAAGRGVLMNRLADLMEKLADELATLESIDTGIPFMQARHVILPLVVSIFRYYSGWCDKIGGHTLPSPANSLHYTRHEPLGVVGQIVPWNFPLLSLAYKWAPAMAAGCCMILKPAEEASLTCIRMGQLAVEAGFPPGVINIVTGLGETVGAAIAAHPGIEKVSFTGGADAGRAVLQASASNFKRTTLELGGKSPNIIFADANLEAAIGNAFAGVFWHQGQICTSGSRVFVEEGVYDAVIDALTAAAKTLVIGDPLDTSTTHGPMISTAQVARVKNYIESGLKEGARLLVGGGVVQGRTSHLQPTIFAAEDHMKIAREEIFGPVMTVFKFKDSDEVIRRANDTNFGLASAVWTRDLNRAHKVANALKAGTVWINCYYALSPGAPVGGYKQSGFGRELGEEAIYAYMNTKSVLINLS